MDRDAFVKDVETAFRRLPEALLKEFGSLAHKLFKEHRQALEAVLPSIASELMPHISAIGFEKAMGILNMSEVEADVMSVLNKVGIKEPEPELSKHPTESVHPTEAAE